MLAALAVDLFYRCGLTQLQGYRHEHARWLIVEYGLIYHVDQFNGEGDGLATADAEAGNPATAAGPSQGIQERDQDPSSTRSDRVPERHGTA